MGEKLNGYCFLEEYSPLSMYFFTLKPLNWEADLKREMDILINEKKMNIRKKSIRLLRLCMVLLMTKIISTS